LAEKRHGQGLGKIIVLPRCGALSGFIGTEVALKSTDIQGGKGWTEKWSRG
jgi:hypothetical protein